MGIFLLAVWTPLVWDTVGSHVWDVMIWMRIGADFIIFCVFMLIWASGTVGAGRIVVIAMNISHRGADRRVILGWVGRTGHSFCCSGFECARQWFKRGDESRFEEYV